MDFAVGLTSMKIKIENFYIYIHTISLASIHKNFIHKFSFFGPSVKILSHEHFPLYSMYMAKPEQKGGLATRDYQVSTIYTDNYNRLNCNRNHGAHMHACLISLGVHTVTCQSLVASIL